MSANSVSAVTSLNRTNVNKKKVTVSSGLGKEYMYSPYTKYLSSSKEKKGDDSFRR